MELEGPRSAVFVSAHTSAGKTVIAEYAIALAAKHRARAVYTSPIKALSNQKYSEWRRTIGGPEGKDVGIITGDVTLNPDAPCLIMTTEILRSMLYRGDDLVRDIEWVIFDEVHYINDDERGVVYEEALLLLPDSVGLIFLSATSPNKEEFAEWVGRVKRKPVWVLGTPKRPVPLNHLLFVPTVGGGSDNAMTLLMDGASIDVGDDATVWKSAHYRLMTERLKARIDKRGGAAAYGPRGSSSAGRSGGGSSKADQMVWHALLAALQKQELLPAIVFSFSKKRCEECAFRGVGSTDLTHAREKAAIHILFEGAVKRLSGTDRELPQIVSLRTLLRRGIGVHHR